MEPYQIVFLLGILTAIGAAATAPLWLDAGQKAQLRFIWRTLQRPFAKTSTREQRAHLRALMQRVDNLMLSLEALLAGDKPADTVMYQMLESYGGTRKADTRLQVLRWLRRAQAGLRSAFMARRELQSEERQNGRSLIQQIEDWETLYVTIVGTQPRILNLNDEELRVLLDPLEILIREPESQPLARQLSHLHRQMNPLPLKIELQMVDVTKLDGEGILGYVDLVEAELAEQQIKSRIQLQNLGLEDAEAELDSAMRLRLSHQTERPLRKLTISERLALARQQAEEFDEQT